MKRTITKNGKEVNIRGMAEGYAMSQSQVAEELFLTQQTIARIERQAIEKCKAVLKEKNLSLDSLV